MRVCVTAMSAGLNAQVDPRFGRAAYFVFVDTDSMDSESVPNPSVGAVGGAGIQSAQLVAGRGARVVITGQMGPNAASALSSAGIEVVLGVQGMTVREAVEAFKAGRLQASAAQATGPTHMGVGPGGGMGIGRGMGLGAGLGVGRGMGRGIGRVGGFGTMPSSPGFASKEDEVTALREEMEFIKGRLEYITRRLQELEKGEKKS
ncbi:MAG: dinitrogenase iron-molybdenum cofactor biosynthesis protein [Aquificota bacterium]|nr:MAG: dinitrogenase iron-molybdenum cofactor biosynthesis protein [Aquificota bacterium]